MNSPLVSINIPIFKCEKYIYRCLESVRNQTYKNLEVILVNDCTPDQSLDEIQRFQNDFPDFKFKLIHHEKNSGLSVVRNTGIDNSNGEYIYFLDSDDEILPNCIELLVKNALETQAQIIIAQNRWINTFDNTTKDFGFPTKSTITYYNQNKTIFEAYANDLLPVVSWNKLFKKDFILNNQIYFVPGLYAQDELWFFHVVEKAETLSIIPDITYLYYLHSDSVIFNRTKVNFENHQTIVEWFTKSYNSADNYKKKLIKRKIIGFKETTLTMQWKSMRHDVTYWKQNYNRLKKAPSLSLIEYFSNKFTSDIKKKNFFQNLPTDLGYRIFKWRYERKF